MILFTRTPSRSVTYGLKLRKDQDGLVITKKTDLEQLTDADLVFCFNAFANTDVKKFADRPTAIDRVWQVMQPSFNAPTRSSKEKTMSESKKAATPEPKLPKLIDITPADKVRAVRAGTRIARTIDLLAAGTTLAALCEDLSKDGTGTPAYVRSWLRFDLRHRTGYGVKSKLAGEDLQLKLVYPEGQRKPLAHLVPEPKAKAPKVTVEDGGQAKAAKASKKGAKAKKAAKAEATAE